MSGFTLRPFEKDDYAAAYDLWTRTEGMGIGASDTREAIATFLARNPGLSQVAVTEAGALAGTLLCGHDGRRGYLHHLAVAKSQRKRGIGSALVNLCTDKLAALGIEKCNLFLLADNEQGRSFWQRQQWNLRHDVLLVNKVLRPSGSTGCHNC